MIKLAMVRITRHIQREGYSTHLILQIHDELVFEVPSIELSQIEPLIREAMSNALTLSVPVVVDINHGLNWLDAH